MLTSRQGLLSTGAVLVVALAVCAGCRSNGGSAEAPTGGGAAGVNERPGPIAGEWTLQKLRGLSVPQGETPGRSVGFTVLTDGSIAGFSGVNRFSGRLDAAGLERGEFRMPGAVSTKMAGPPELMKLEGDFLRALEEAERYVANESTLTLFEGNDVLAVLLRAR
ncbi:MAG: META domain-containing protein [Planctomycetota bacterium]|nr:META domain-containing protein [Planctomycetota bacterium]